MPGKWVDRAALALLGTVGFYLFFLNAGLGVVWSGLLAFVCVDLGRQLVRYRPGRHRITRARAEASLRAIAMMEEDAATEALSALTDKPDPVCLLRHPDSALSLDAVYKLWRERGDGITAIVTCEVRPEASLFAKERGMVIIDRNALVKRIRETGRFAVEETDAVPFLPKLAAIWRGIRVRPRVLVYGMSLFGAYFATGQILCLICALTVMGICGTKLIERYA